MTEERAPTLPELLDQATRIVAKIAEAGGELTPELEAAFDNVNISVASKVDGYAFVMDRLKLDEEFFRERYRYFRKIADACEAARDRLRGKILESMQTFGLEEVKGAEMKFKIQRAKNAVDVNEPLLPQEYKKEVITWVPEKERIAQDLELGLEIPGASFREVKYVRAYANTAERKTLKGK